ncbi:LysR family transcriptional regulator [Lichenibacterium ramalinae]|uniref:LysR family transcriptional regulator n=2 Tax=Lichenibacterium ramalinae TaxID=2316527 RepID=A0A4Q2R7I3_9HYPH|nr:LysR family transcriptional regulator [Lichenibacterium ramalinae]
MVLRVGMDGGPVEISSGPVPSLVTRLCPGVRADVFAYWKCVFALRGGANLRAIVPRKGRIGGARAGGLIRRQVRYIPDEPLQGGDMQLRRLRAANQRAIADRECNNASRTAMLDWDDLRFFLSIARHGNLITAAKELRVAQSTAGRRLASLEANLGVRLLNRTPDGYVVTAAGEQVLREAERFETGSLALEREVGGRDARLAGAVRVTCAEGVASHILSPCLSAMHDKHPDIMVELIPDQRELSLSMREAEVSVRLKQSNQHDLVVRKIGILGFGLYASPGYLDKRGDLDFEAGSPGHHIVAQLDDLQDSDQTGWLAALAPRARISLQTSSHEAAVVAAVHGGGLACLARVRADREDGLTRLATPSPVPDTGIWLVAHKDNRGNARIRAVMTQITDGIRTMAPRLNPAD